MTDAPAPTALSMKLKFPEFVGQSDAVIELAIEEARLEVDDSWDDYQTLATMYLAAHHMMVSISRAQSGTGLATKSVSIDGISFSYDTTNATTPDAKDLTSTPYGSRFMSIRDRITPGIMLI